MEPAKQELLVSTWIKHHQDQRATGKVPEETFWAWDELDRLCWKYPEQAWDTILQILEADQSDVIRENLAAGPLEDLLVHHGAKIIARVEEKARQDPRFRLLLGGVWERSIQPEVWARVEKARGGIW
jgi:hypothetical protein